MVFLQETWLFNFELHILSNISYDFEGFGVSSIDDSTGIVRGRPYGPYEGMAIIVRKKYRRLIELQQYGDPRILGINVKSSSELHFFFSVYMPYQCPDNLELHVHGIYW